MTLRKLIYVGLLISTACGKADIAPEEDCVPAGKFLVSEASGYALSLTTKSGQSSHYKSEDGSMHVAVSESEWDGIEVAQTKSNVSGEDVFWPDSPELSLYITDPSDNLLRGDLAMNPCSYQVYYRYDIAGGYIDNKKYGYCQNITNSSFFWNEWDETDKLLNNAEVNFYGYYPRPKDETNWLYVSNSVIDKGSARDVSEGSWNKLQFNLTVDQTDDNISFFDVMCSIPETADNGTNRPGNKEKSKDDDIHLAFKHMFSLLEFEIYRAPSYVGSCKISGLCISGKQVYNSGTLDIRTMELSYQDGGHTLTRSISEEEIKDGVPFKTELIVLPTNDEPDKNNPDGDRLMVTCKVDGADYSCPLPDLKLESGKKYKLKLTITPSGIVMFRVWQGASVNVGNGSFGAGEHPETSKSESFTVSPDDSFKILKVLENGTVITPSDGKYKLNRVEGANTYYDVVAAPSEDWYSEQDKMRIHFDALWNDKYGVTGTQTSGVTVWNDLTGNNNDGSLVAFDGTAESGWTRSGLAFDGLDDILTFPGNVSSGDYTVEFYIYVDKTQKKVYPRLLGEDEKNLTGYPSFCLNSDTGANYRLSLCGNGSVNHDLTKPYAIYLRGNVCQLDCVYKSGERRLYFYQDGEYKAVAGVKMNSSSIPKASLGNRVQDNTRALKATYYSFILYDKALTEEEIKANYDVNVARYGTSK